MEFVSSDMNHRDEIKILSFFEMFTDPGVE